MNINRFCGYTDLILCGGGVVDLIPYYNVVFAMVKYSICIYTNS